MNNSIFLLHPAHASFLDNSNRKLFGVTVGQIILLLIVAVICAGLGGGMTVYAVNEQTVQDTLAQNGVQALATITDGRVSRGRSTSYYLEYRYDAEVNGDLRTFTREESVSRDLYDRAEIGGHLTVRYMPDDPATARAIDQPFNGLIFILMGLAFVAGSVIGIYALIRQYRRDRLLERDGQILTGSITKSSVSGYGNKRQVHIKYEFHSPLGVPLKGSQSQRRRDLEKYDLPPEGTRVAVVYCDDNTYRVL
ncbi:MAG: DUF3592 domain-containing protein [Anaerolineae bacterium]|nr:DUF3592 domain-containing protein [Anaerolineae bacterium]